MIRVQVYINVFLFLNLFLHSTKADELELVQIIFRHGDRTPSKEEIYPKLSYNPIYDTLGYGQLTERGKIREFCLGTMLRKRYSTFLGRSHTYGSVYAYSTDIDRTKMSLQLVLAGIYPPTLTDSGYLELSPIPAYYEPLIVDNILCAENCPRYKQEYKKIKATPTIVSTVLENKKLFEYIGENTGIDMTVDPILSTYGLYIFLTTQESLNITLPEWATEEVQTKMKPIVELEYQIRSYNTLMKRLNGGHLVQEFIKNMNAKRNQTSPKVYVYSGHEINVAAFAKAHNFVEPEIPSFGSAIIVEKLRDSKGKHFVQLYLWTGVTQELKPYKLSKCDKKCPYEKYITIMEHVIPLEEDLNCSWNNVSLDQLHQYYSTTVDT
ncbi:hypothetical protein QLX08_005321 [Tetragonisca angustula]|uniref:acid phosphatase n=1 Tax=Tetragonisca angustula TaxID=166442 RepID=A0AAW1A0Y2_9HYME